jgi:hypothetical protein
MHPTADSSQKAAVSPRRGAGALNLQQRGDECAAMAICASLQRRCGRALRAPTFVPVAGGFVTLHAEFFTYFIASFGRRLSFASML